VRSVVSDDPAWGVTTVSDRLLLVTAATVTGWEREGTPAGVVVFSRIVDDDLLAELAKYSDAALALCVDGRLSACGPGRRSAVSLPAVTGGGGTTFDGA
jgi:hypothetical protein